MTGTAEDDPRPLWPHKEMSEKDFRSIKKIGFICAVEGKWEFTSADTSREWLEATDRDKKKHVLPSSWKAALKFTGSAHNPGLFEYTYEGKRMNDTVAIIDAWEKKNKADRATYERLKKRFGTTDAGAQP